MEQLDMWAAVSSAPKKQPAAKPIPGKPPRWKRTIEERCADFDAAHPEVYAEIRRLAIEAHQQGRRRVGIGMLVELARWNLSTPARDEQGFKINNDYRRCWSRRLVAEYPALASMFEMRATRLA